ncbi:hypothetical protein ACCO45_000012 [Purpureocillium lilacinum]|uniref:Uncharacterized protein n=1 Tax=Purpureocillium lilacinum TaxID=33203 RepID=A0ACC4EAM7_PURLI
MAGAYKRKRHTDLPTETSPPAKRCKFARRHRATPFAPSFWDILSKVSLTSLALREIDRRNEERQHSPIPAASGEVVSKDIARFARHGGPDLRHLRGVVPSPESRCRYVGNSIIYEPRSRQTESTGATSVTPQKQKIVRDIQSELAKQRASLSPSKFSDGAFETFQRRNEDVVFESDVMATLVPRVCGTSDIHSKQKVLFTELEPITDDTAVKPKPDFSTEHVCKTSAKYLGRITPNLFMEAKAPSGGADVAGRQACYDGAYGARAMHALQNYGEAKPTYDDNAYTFSSTYHDGTLKLYTHHVTAPSTAEGRPEYHMTQLDTWGMTGNIDSFRRGATAFRNAREMAERYRGTFIRAANTRAASATTVDNAGVTAADEETSASAQLEALEPAEPSERGAWQDADNVLQQLIADGEGRLPQGEAEQPPCPGTWGRRKTRKT